LSYPTPGASSEDILQLTTEAFDATIKTNIYAPFWMIKAAVPHLQPGSCIIATTSEQAYDPAANLYDYAQTKAATMNYVKSLIQRVYASMELLQGRSGHRSRSPAEPPRIT
jgi:NAD(P)-dependent dehydrogenase (short-subunit alcohol dehydrogenase family)